MILNSTLRAAASWYTKLQRLVLTTAFVLAILSSVGATYVYAAESSGCPDGMSNLDCNSLYQNWPNWIPDPGTTCTTENSGDLTGSDNIEKAFNFLVSKGLSAAQAAGIVGNLIGESSLDPKADSGSHKGIAQWDAGGRWAQLVSWAKDNGLDPYSLDAQLQYLWKEAVARGNIDGIKKYDDVPHTTWYWGRYFEVAIIGGNTSETPLTNVQNLAGRTAAAQQVFAKYGGSVAAPATTNGSADYNDCSSAVSSGDLGVGKGSFTDSGEVKGWDTILANAQLSEAVYGDSLEWRGACASIVSRVWHGSDIGFGFSPHYAMTLYHDNPQYVHKDRNPKKGSILLYTGGTVYGHVTIYLGNNKILNDGHITDATVKSDDFVAWADPNDFGWTTHRIASKSAMHGLLDQYLSWPRY